MKLNGVKTHSIKNMIAAMILMVRKYTRVLYGGRGALKKAKSFVVIKIDKVKSYFNQS